MHSEDSSIKAMKKGVISLSLILFALFLIPPVHEFVHALVCFENGGEVVEVEYWSNSVCGGSVKSKAVAEMNFLDNMNEEITQLIFYSLLISGFGLGLHSGFTLLRYYLKNSGTEQYL